MYLILKNFTAFLSIVFVFDNVCECLEELNTILDIKKHKLNKDEFKFNDILYLTPYIEDDRLEEAIADSEVKNLPGIGNQVKSYSGFLTVNKKFNSNLFFWFFPPVLKDPYAPGLLWLSPGSADASVRGMFTLNGPIQVDENGNPSLRYHNWNYRFGVLYIDNPVGTGFSFTDNDDGYARDSYDVAVDLYEGLRQFFTIFEYYRSNALYLTGYSTACKYQTTLANRILEINSKPKTKIKMNLQGVAIGGGYCDPRNQYDFADFSYQVGLIQERDWTYFWLRQLEYLKLILQHKWVQANDLINELYYGFGRADGSYFQNASGYVSLANFLNIEEPPEMNFYTQYLNRRDTKRAIHVGRRQFNRDAATSAQMLYLDIAKSVKPQIEKLLNANVRMMFYNGNLDMVSPVSLMENVLRNLQWNGSRKYLDATKQIYRYNRDESDGNSSQVGAYYRVADNLQFVILRNAGRFTSLDQAHVTQDIITRFVKGINFNSVFNRDLIK